MSGNVIWITGLSAAGKTALAKATVSQLRSRRHSVVLLDGDELRGVFGVIAADPQSHCREGRLELAMKYARLCRVLADQGLTVVIATISLFKEVHAWNRQNLSGYFEVYLKVPIEELRRRDPKGIYRRFDAGALINVAGLDMPVDEPDCADLVIEFRQGKSPATLAEELIAALKSRRGTWNTS
jgi:cytidine diphosphoramidate kinase